MNHKLRCTFSAIAITIACCSSGCGSEDSWQDHTSAGRAALAKGHYAEAENELSLALKAAENPVENLPLVGKLLDIRLSESLSSLAEVYCREEKYREAESLYKHALAVGEKADAFVEGRLTDLAECYRTQRKYAEAEPLLRRALAMDEKSAGPTSTTVAEDLNNLAVLLTEQGKDSEAAPLYERALTIEELPEGPFPTHLAQDLNALANVYRKRGKYGEAETRVKRALTDMQDSMGPNSPDTGIKLNNLATLYYAEGKYQQAEPLLKHSLMITENLIGGSMFQSYPQPELRETTAGDNNPVVAIKLNNLSELYYAEGKYIQAEPLLKRSLLIIGNTLGASHPSLATTLSLYVAVLRKTNRAEEAEKLEAIAKSIRARQK